jgi:hypothetical protein
LVGIIFVFLLLQIVLAQTTGTAQMINQLRLTPSQLAGNVYDVQLLIKSNNISKILDLLAGMKIKIDLMNIVFNDLVWELSIKGY